MSRPRKCVVCLQRNEEGGGYPGPVPLRLCLPCGVALAKFTGRLTTLRAVVAWVASRVRAQERRRRERLLRVGRAIVGVHRDSKSATSILVRMVPLIAELEEELGDG